MSDDATQKATDEQPAYVPGVTGTDPETRPQDDLFGHVNGHWFATAMIPPDLPTAGVFVDLVLDAERQAADILRDAADRSARRDAEAGSNLQKLGDLFAGFMDEERVEALGATPLADDLAAIEAVSDTGELVRLVGRLERSGVSGFVNAYVDTDDQDSDRYVVKMLQGGIGLPDESYYRDDTFAEVRVKYVAHVAAMLELLGRSAERAADEAARIMGLESRLASGHWDRVQSRDVVKTYNLMTREDAVCRDAEPRLGGVDRGDVGAGCGVRRGGRAAAAVPRDARPGADRRTA